MALHCPLCLPLHAAGAQLIGAPLHCRICGENWPALDGIGQPIEVLVPDAAQGEALVRCVSELMQNPQRLQSWVDGDDPLRAALASGLLTYAQAHYGRFAPEELPHPDLGWLRGWLPADLPAGRVVVLGSGPGGELAALAGDPALRDREIALSDSNLAALAWGQRLAAEGSLALPWRISATRLAWTQVRLPAEAQRLMAQAHWVCADALHPVWPAGEAAVVVTMALIDTVVDPIALIQQVEALLAPGGVWLVASPWCWQNRVTPVARQLERFVENGALEDGLAALLTGAVIEGLGSSLRLERREDSVPWRLQMHPRFVANYALQVMLLRRT